METCAKTDHRLIDANSKFPVMTMFGLGSFVPVWHSLIYVLVVFDFLYDVFCV